MICRFVLLWTGIVLAVLATVILSIHVTLITGSGNVNIPISDIMVTAYAVAACLLELAPGLMLLYFGQALKRENTWN